MSTRATVRLTTRCDNACRFCGQHGTPEHEADDWAHALDAARGQGADEVTFVGGEPTLAASLEPAVAHARAIGFAAIGVQTHARAFATRDAVQRLAAAGMSDVHVSIHGARASIHDYHVGVDGSFDAMRAALGHLRASGIEVVATTVLSRSNARALGELPAWLDHHGVLAWRVAVPHVAGRAATEFDRVVPRLALAIPFALHALDRAGKLGLGVVIDGAPACLLGPWIAAATGATRHFAAPCEACPARPGCVGVDAHYLARFGGDELRPRAAGVRTNAAMPDRLQRMFVGPGLLVEASPASHESPGAARRRLPVLHRPQPGRDETRRAPEGAEALFPELNASTKDPGDDEG